MERFRGHRLFAAVCDFATTHESAAERRLRERAAGGVYGRILEIGVGVGPNWRFLPADADYVGIDPDPHMLKRGLARMRELPRTFDVLQARAEKLPFNDHSFDSVLVTLALCTVEDSRGALAEAGRVLKPEGRLVFVEHVRPEGRVRGWLADRIERPWGRMAGGCHPNRRTAAMIEAAGFEFEHLQRKRVNGLPFISGVATKLARPR